MADPSPAPLRLRFADVAYPLTIPRMLPGRTQSYATHGSAPRTLRGHEALAFVVALAWSRGADLPADPSPALPRRIVAIAPNTAEVICTIGACDRIVGVSKFCVYPPELAHRPQVGGLSDPDLERIIALRPDLVVMRGKNDSLQRLCEQLHVPIYYDETDTLPGIEQGVQELGRRLGREEQAREVVQTFHRRLDAVRARVAGRQRPRVLLTISREPGRLANLLTAGRGTFLDQMVEAAGGLNIFGHLDMTYPQVSPEGVIAQQPEVIIELLPEVKLTEAMEKQMLEQWGRLGTIPAVVHHRVHFLTDDNGLIPSPRYVDIIEKVSHVLHPERPVDP